MSQISLYHRLGQVLSLPSGESFRVSHTRRSIKAYPFLNPVYWPTEKKCQWGQDAQPNGNARPY